ncbi:hypothetical protein [Listeria valentina]|uniref:hypothetical protein n=1 Tax=Listeria valentina TaxID=2705293 RepID=UPI001430E768|nr:hypothetical protein [Listeria valentina]
MKKTYLLLGFILIGSSSTFLLADQVHDQYKKMTQREEPITIKSNSATLEYGADADKISEKQHVYVPEKKKTKSSKKKSLNQLEYELYAIKESRIEPAPLKDTTELGLFLKSISGTILFGVSYGGL